MVFNYFSWINQTYIFEDTLLLDFQLLLYDAAFQNKLKVFCIGSDVLQSICALRFTDPDEHATFLSGLAKDLSRSVVQFYYAYFQSLHGMSHE